MATCDPDGRIMQSLRDRQACLLMEMYESLAESVATMDALLGDLDVRKALRSCEDWRA